MSQLDKLLDKITKKVDQVEKLHDKESLLCEEVKDIEEIREIIPNIPVLALTATATSSVIHDIQESLNFKDKNLIQSSFSRVNLSYVVDNVEDKKSRLIKLLNKIKYLFFNVFLSLIHI